MCPNFVLHYCSGCWGSCKQRFSPQRNQDPTSPASGNGPTSDHRTPVVRGGCRAIERRAWCFAAAEEEPKQRRSTMEQYSKSVCALLSLGLDHLTSEIQHWGDKEMAEGAEGKGPMSKEQMLQGRVASQPGKRKKRMENTPKQEKKACRRRKKI